MYRIPAKLYKPRTPPAMSGPLHRLVTTWFVPAAGYSALPVTGTQIYIGATDAVKLSAKLIQK